jgi:hypothetical protein
MAIHLSGAIMVWNAEAIATLISGGLTFVTGIGAVIAAYIVGRRQTKIANRQTEILDRQVALAETNLKADLFERRLSTYEAAAAFVLHLGDLGETEEGKARIDLFGTKLRESQFLFRPEVYQALLEIWEAGNQFRVARAESISRREDQLPSDPELARRIEGHMFWSLERLKTLHEVFRPDLAIDSRSLMISKND